MNDSTKVKPETLLAGVCRKMPVGKCKHVASQEQEVDQLGGAQTPYDIAYQFKFGNTTYDANSLLGKHITLSWSGSIYCVSCGRKTNKSYAQGHCYPCFTSSASCDLCIMQPERCHYHLGTCREPEWAQGMCFKEHIVYLSYTSGVKVGITRQTQVSPTPTRWIDQGATAAVPIFTTSSRRLAGVVEQYFKDYLADKTDWRKMLKGNPTDDTDAAQILTDTRDELFSHHLFALQESINERDMITTDSYEVLYDMPPLVLQYPVLEHPKKVKSLNLEKTPEISGKLMGIKGQYLLLDTGVLNVRKFSGYELTLTEANK